MNNWTNGIRRGELTVIAAGTGVGKTTFVKDCVIGMLENPQNKNIKIGIISLEDNFDSLRKSLISKVMKQNYNRESWDDIPDKEIVKAEEILSRRIEIVKTFGNQEYSNILDVAKTLVVSYECNIIIVDNLTKLITTKEAGSSAYEIEHIINSFDTHCGTYDYACFLAVHLRKSKGLKSFEEGAEVSTDDLYGGGILKPASWGFALQKNPDDPQNNELIVKCLKDRLTGQNTYKKFSLWYDPDSTRLQYKDIMPEISVDIKSDLQEVSFSDSSTSYCNQ